MKTNFDFLKKIDKDLYEIIFQAENLYRQEFFEPCMAQVRHFGEIVCKNILNPDTPETFDNMLATLKDKIASAQEKEFIDDLYFIKKCGNQSVHSVKIKSDGMLALECLQRAFEVGINYAVYYKKSDFKILKLRYDTELLITGKESKKSLAEKYTEEKEKNTEVKTPKATKKKNNHKKNNKTIHPKRKSNLFFKIIMILSIIISFSLILSILILTHFA